MSINSTADSENLKRARVNITAALNIIHSVQNLDGNDRDNIERLLEAALQDLFGLAINPE